MIAKTLKSGIFCVLFSYTMTTLAQSPISEIRGGKPSSGDAFEAVVQIGTLSYDDNGIMHFKHTCSAALIDSDTVLTAAHCQVDPYFATFLYPREWAVVKSVDNRSVQYKLEEIQARTESDLELAGIFLSFASPENYAVHPNYTLPLFDPDATDLEQFENLEYPVIGKHADVMILKLNTPFPSSVSPLRVANRNMIRGLRSGTPVKAVGYGTIDGKTLSPELKQVDLRLSSLAECRKHYKKILQEMSPEEAQEAASNPFPNNSQICTYEKNRGICGGDSGGPLIAFENGRRVIIGVTSWGYQHGEECADPNDYKLDVWSKPTFYASWFDSVSGLDYSVK